MSSLASVGRQAAVSASTVTQALRCVAASTASPLSGKHGSGAAPVARRGLSSTTTVGAYKAPINDIKFLMNEVYDIPAHYTTLENTGGLEATDDMTSMVLEASAQFAENDLAPLNESADKEGCKHVGPNEVKTPKGFKKAYDTYTQGGWQGLSVDPAWGGQGLPASLGIFATEMYATANWTWAMYPGLSKGAINTIYMHASEDLKQKYLHRLVSGEWTGTMCLTEPQCGSDLAQVTTKAIPQGNGSYKITGTKIFISCGEHDMTDNIVHCVLARLPDAPEGTKGISLFLVPKRKVADDGTVGDLNGVTVGRIEDKMGCHGSSTCELNFEDAEGFLIGSENRGLNHMFTFINTSRIGTAIQGVAAAEGSFQNALWYAKDRLAMRSLSGKKNKKGPADPIIVHPDVRKMLLIQKAVAEGGRSMIHECAIVADKMIEANKIGDTKAEQSYDDRLGFLTPILKGFLTEKGVEAANHGVQVYGGHGYIKSNHQEQILRDVRIASLWEGTTQIQALDLLGRKVLLQKLKPINQHCAKLYEQSWNLFREGSSPSVKKHARQLLAKTAQWHYITYKIAALASRDREVVGVAAVDYLHFAGYVTLASHWLRMEEAATKKLKDGTGAFDDGFYEAKIKTSKFYFDCVLPRTKAHAATMFAPSSSLMSLESEKFSFDY